MKLVKWFKNLWEDKEEIEDDIEYYCPKCGSTQIGYFSIMSNFVQVINGQEEPKYIETQKCSNCGFKSTDRNELGKRKKNEKTGI